MDQSTWAGMRERFAAIFLTRTREEWVKMLQPLETCFSPVLTLEEALGHEHNVARSAFVPVDGVLQAAPAPRFGRTPGEIAGPAARPGEHTEEALRDWGFGLGEITDLLTKQAIVQLGVPR
jgi:alpha-methylacyl-CoA racemase